MNICTCAVVVREGNEAIQIDICDKTQIIPTVTSLSNTTDARIHVEQSNDGLNFLVGNNFILYY